MRLDDEATYTPLAQVAATRRAGPPSEMTAFLPK
jgi:hypothetical protein